MYFIFCRLICRFLTGRTSGFAILQSLQSWLTELVTQLASWSAVYFLWLVRGCGRMPRLREAVLCPIKLTVCVFFLLFSFLNVLKNSVLISFVKDKDAPTWWGFLIAALMFACAVLQTLILHQHFQYCFVTGMRLRTGIIGVIYRKVRLEAFHGPELRV